MLVVSMNEQSVQISEINVAQNHKKPREKRGREARIGRLKYNQQLLKEVLATNRRIDEKLSIVINGLKGAGYFHFSVPLIQRFACVDQVDLEILHAVYETGQQGILPKDVAARLPEYNLKHYHVTRRVQRMNKRLEHETAELLFEKRGWKWALTRFAFDVWGETDKVGWNE
jgi:hypothetical protein